LEGFLRRLLYNNNYYLKGFQLARTTRSFHRLSFIALCSLRHLVLFMAIFLRSVGITLDYVLLMDSPRFKTVVLLQTNHVNHVEHIFRSENVLGNRLSEV